jgi:hypothetical protein
MAKRLTDSRKWDDPWFVDLDFKYKVFWFYVLDKCSHAGIFQYSERMVEFHTGLRITHNDIKTVFKDRLYRYDQNKYFIPKFVIFQNPDIESDKVVCKSIRKLLFFEKIQNDFSEINTASNLFDFFKELNPYLSLKEPLVKACLSLKGKGKGKGKGNIKNINIDKRHIESIYTEYYPRKEGKTKGIKKLEKDLKSDQDLIDFKKAVKNYNSKIKKEGQELKYVKLFSTFAGEWRDYIDFKTEPDTRSLFDGLT